MASRLNCFLLTGIAALVSSRNGFNHTPPLCQIKAFTSACKEISVSPRETIVLNCSTILGGPETDITWSKEGHGLVNPVSTKMTTMPGLWSSLEINNVSAKDAGRYKCHVSKGKEWDDCKVSIYVNSRPNINTSKGYFTTTPQVLPVGHNPVFHCYATGWPTPSFSWFKNGKPIKDGDNTESYMLTKRPNGLDLKILYVRVTKHAGRYRCMAKNKFGQAQHDVFLIVQDNVALLPPSVYSPRDQVTLERNDQALLTCVGMNTPRKSTIVSWCFNGSLLSPDDRRNSHYQSDFIYYEDDYTTKVNFSLVIRNVTERDSGAYRCEVLTPKGNSSDSIHLDLVQPGSLGSHQARGKALLMEMLLVCAAIICGLLVAVITCRIWNKRKRHFRCDLQSREYQFDVFVSFSSRDYNWVKDKLIPVLDHKRVKYCIHSRDFVVGKAVIENIADSVYNSRRVLAVISHNYMSSKFCREELEISLYRCTEMDDDSLLVIRVDDIDIRHLPKTLRRRTFLDYTSASERSSWEQRLLNHIKCGENGPTATRVRSVNADKVQLFTEVT